MEIQQQHGGTHNRRVHETRAQAQSPSALEMEQAVLHFSVINCYASSLMVFVNTFLRVFLLLLLYLMSE